jgi:hypothetical protein
MTFRTHYNHKIKVRCVRCVPSCLPLLINGKHPQALPHKLFVLYVYHVYHCARTRTCGVFYTFNFSCSFEILTTFKKTSRVRNIILMVNMVHILIKVLCEKGLLCVSFFFNHKQKLIIVNIAFQVIVFKLNKMCTIVFGYFNQLKGDF